MHSGPHTETAKEQNNVPCLGQEAFSCKIHENALNWACKKVITQVNSHQFAPGIVFVRSNASLAVV